MYEIFTSENQSRIIKYSRNPIFRDSIFIRVAIKNSIRLLISKHFISCAFFQHQSFLESKEKKKETSFLIPNDITCTRNLARRRTYLNTIRIEENFKSGKIIFRLYNRPRTYRAKHYGGQLIAKQSRTTPPRQGI